MVYAFIIHTLLPGPCRVLFSTVFTPGTQQLDEKSGDEHRTERNDSHSAVGGGSSTDGGDIREQRKMWVLGVAEDVQADYNARVKLSNKSYEQDFLTLQNEGTLPEFELGFFRVPASRLKSRQNVDNSLDQQQQTTLNSTDASHSQLVNSGDQEDKVVVWLGALNCGFTLVCEQLENRLLAENVLKVIIKYLHEHVKPLHQPSQVLQRPERVAMVTRQFLPSGRLLPMNHRLVRQFEKELEANMKLQ